MHYKDAMLDAPWQLVTQIDGGQSIIKAVAVCACGSKHEITARRHLPPDVIEKKFTKAGWTAKLRTNVAQCEKCSRPRLIARKQRGTMMLSTKSAKVEPIRPPTLKQTREIMMALESFFDDKKGAYSAGYDDSKVAKELDLPRVMVEQVRREAFGELRVDPGLQAAFEKIDALSRKITHAQGIIADAAAALRGISDEVEAMKRGIGKQISNGAR